MTGALPSATRRHQLSRTRCTVNTLWLVNGTSTVIDPADRGLAYGDGLFETMAASDGHVRWLDLHFDRLEEGCRRLEIPAPARSLLAHEIGAHCPTKGRAVVKLIITRGPGARGYLPPDPATPTRLLAISPWPDYPDAHYREGIGMHVCQLRLGENPALAGIKHLCRLEQVLAALELRGHAVQQGLLLDASGNVAGGTTSNLFAVRGSALTTPTLARCGIKGVMRRAVLETARTLGMRADENDFGLSDLLEADELFVTNALFGIWPVVDIDGKRFPIGRTTQRLMTALDHRNGH
jgi:4-amino-4-deoxychorismate lyase